MKQEMIRNISAVIAVTLLAGLFLHLELANSFFQQQRVAVTQELSLYRTHLEHQITGSLLVIEGTALFISEAPDLTREKFQSYAAAALKNKPLIKNIAAAPDLVIRYVYPVLGNESIQDLDYRTVPGQWADVKKVMDTGHLVTAGPLTLIQGGTGVVVRAPVYTPENGQPWGMVSSVLDMDRLYGSTGLMSAEIAIAIRKKEGDQRVFFGNPALFLETSRSVTMALIIPGAQWELAATPKGGWASIFPQMAGVYLLLLLLGAGLGYWRIKSIQKTQAIREIRKSLDLSQAISHLGSWSLDLKTHQLWWSDETYRILGLDKSQTLPDLDLFLSMIPEEDRDYVHAALDNALTQGTEYQLDHGLIRKDGRKAQVEARGFVDGDAKGVLYRFNGTLLDITHRKRAEQELRGKEAQMRAMARASHDALIMIDARDSILFWSDMAEKMFGWSAEEALGKSMHRLITLPDDQDKAQQGLKHFSRTGTGPVIGTVTEFDAVCKDGTVIPVERSVAAFQLGAAHYAVGSLRDIRDRREKEARLLALATTDSLTGLLNRRRFMELIAKELKKSQRHLVPFSVVMFDADKFKRINDTFGHEAGDKVLKDLARTVRQIMRETDFSGRLGGEEFALGLPFTDLQGAVQLAERMRAAFEASAVDIGEETPLHFTASFGVACCQGNCFEAEALLKQADTALYQAKEKGRNRVAVFTQPPG